MNAEQENNLVQTRLEDFIHNELTSVADIAERMGPCT